LFAENESENASKNASETHRKRTRQASGLRGGDPRRAEQCVIGVEVPEVEVQKPLEGQLRWR